MKTLLIRSLSIVVLALGLSACNVSNQDVGMAAGGVLGGVAGSAITGGSAAGAVVGAVGGAFVGRELAK
jgi:osmotically inducible lipoprotein OsmB